MTARELVDLIDKQATLTTQEGLEVVVHITDARELFARIDVLVTPAHGSGQAWVSAERVRVKG